MWELLIVLGIAIVVIATWRMIERDFRLPEGVSHLDLIPPDPDLAAAHEANEELRTIRKELAELRETLEQGGD